MTIVVTGATGNVGRPLVAELCAAGTDVHAVTRTPQTAGFPDGVEVLGSANDALPGAAAVFLNSRALGPEIDALPNVVAQSVRAGVTKLVALSAINADDDFSRQPSRFRGDRNKEVEQLAIDSGLAWVSLRPAVFATNFAGLWSTQIRAGDVVAGPYTRASSVPIIDNDISAIAARALLSEELVGQQILLTGPQAFANAESVEVIGGVVNRPLVYRELPPGVVRQQFIALGFTAEFADAYLALLADTLDKPALVTRDVEKILGRSGRTFTQWLSQHRGLFSKQIETERHRDMSNPRPPRYLKPMNKVMMAVQKLGIATGPAMVLTVPGRTSGRPRSTPMTPFEFAGGLYVVAGYPGADWAANARVAGSGTLARGRRSRRVRITELTPEEARPVLRAFPIKVPVGVGFAKRSGMVRDGTPDEFEALAGRVAVFRFEPS